MDSDYKRINGVAPISLVPQEGFVGSKSRCYSSYYQESFGNRALNWPTYQDIIDSGWTKGVCMRSRKGVDRKLVKYNISLSKVRAEIEKWKKKGFDESSINFNQSMPDKHLLIQGEVTNCQGEWQLLYSREKLPMNKALAKKSESVKGLNALMLLRRSLCPSSFSDLEALLELFPLSTLEFSTYSVNVGNIPGRNTVIWEVRNY